MVDPAEILDALARRVGGDPDLYPRLLELVRAESTGALRLLQLAIQRGGESDSLLGSAVSFVPESMLPSLGKLAAEAFLRDRDNEVAESVIAFLSLQSVGCLQPYLPRFFYTRPNETAYYGEWPWRSADDTETTRLLELLRSTTSEDERLEIFNRILEARIPKYISKALDIAGSESLPFDAANYINEVGFDGPERRLYTKTVYHIKFPADELWYHRSEWSPRKRDDHPTWNLTPIDGRHRFGGMAESACAVCDGPLHNLMTFESVPDGIDIPCRGRLQIATCMSCLGWSKSPLFFRHDEDGRPSAMDSERIKPEFPAFPFREAWVELSATPPRWQWQDWYLSDDRENLHRVGGYPTWIQGAEYPTCPICRILMPLFMQLGSGLPTQDGDRFDWGLGGICYVFWCGNCRVSASLWQST